MLVPQAALEAQYRAAVARWPWMHAVEAAFGLPDCLLFAEGSKETRLVPEYAAGKVHDDGHGYGLFGADDRWNPEVADWAAFARNAVAQAELCASRLKANIARSGLVDGINAYGPQRERGYGPDNYGPDVVARMEFLQTLKGGRSTMVVSRAEWGADAPEGVTAAPGMTRGVGVHWLGEGLGPTSHGQCAPKMREVQAFHMGPQRNWADFAYNAAVCAHGSVFAGRGPKVRNAANGGNSFRGYDANAGWFAVLYLAGSDGPGLTPEAKDGINAAAEWGGVAQGDWLGHRDFLSTDCPGDEAYGWTHGGHPRGGGAVLACEDQVFGLDDSGSCVARIQQLLGFTGADVDGDFGPKTEAAVKALQHSRGLPEDGRVGSQTWAALGAPAPTPKMEVVSMWIFNAPASRGGGIYYTNGRTKWGVPGEAALIFYARGEVPHLGDISEALFDALAWDTSGQAAKSFALMDTGQEATIDPRMTMANTLEEAMEASAFETGDPGCG